VETIENKEVVFFVGAKMCKRVRKRLKKRGIGVGSKELAVEGMAVVGAVPTGGYTPPVTMKRVRK